MSFRIHPLWWPAITAMSPLLVPALAIRNHRFHRNKERAIRLNEKRLRNAKPLGFPVVQGLEWTVLVEHKTEEGFLGAPGVSYLLGTEQGSVLLDVGFGPEKPALLHNARKLGIDLERVDALAISHLHGDHMGGMRAQMRRQVTLPPELGSPAGKPCFLPDQAEVKDFCPEVVEGPRLLAAGIASTGPLARSLFFLGWTEEQALIANVKGKGLVVITGCGHPTIQLILSMVRRLSDEPIHAIGGGLHFPLKRGRGDYAGIQAQMLMGTGKPPWQRITEEELTAAIIAINDSGPKHVLLSGHDTDDYALKRLENGLDAETTVLEAGRTYQI